MRVAPDDRAPPPFLHKMAADWRKARTRSELRETFGWGVPRVVTTIDAFSVHHPLIPTRYVPAWQLDMRNRRNIVKVYT